MQEQSYIQLARSVSCRAYLLALCLVALLEGCDLALAVTLCLLQLGQGARLCLENSGRALKREKLAVDIERFGLCTMTREGKVD